MHLNPEILLILSKVSCFPSCRLCSLQGKMCQTSCLLHFLQRFRCGCNKAWHFGQRRCLRPLARSVRGRVRMVGLQIRINDRLDVRYVLPFRRRPIKA